MNIIKFRPYCFEAFGLNKFRNFCVGNEEFEFEDADELNEFAIETLNDDECMCSAIFFYGIDDSMFAYVKYDGDTFDETDILSTDFENLDDENALNDYIFEDVNYNIDIITSNIKNNMEFFAKIDGDYRLCCYSLVIQQPNKKWRVL